MRVTGVAFAILISACQESGPKTGRVEGAVFVNREGVVLKASGGEVRLLLHTDSLRSDICALRGAYDRARQHFVDSIVRERQRGRGRDQDAIDLHQLVEWERYHQMIDSVAREHDRSGAIDVDSRYVFDSVPPGRYLIFARLLTTGDNTEWLDTVIVRAGSTIRRDLSSPVTIPPALNCDALTAFGDDVPS